MGSAVKTLLDIVYYTLVASGIGCFLYAFGTKSGRHTMKEMIRPRWVLIALIAEIPLAALVVFLFNRYHVTDQDLHDFTSWMGLIGIALIVVGILIRLIRGRRETSKG